MTYRFYINVVTLIVLRDFNLLSTKSIINNWVHDKNQVQILKVINVIGE